MDQMASNPFIHFLIGQCEYLWINGDKKVLKKPTSCEILWKGRVHLHKMENMDGFREEKCDLNEEM